MVEYDTQSTIVVGDIEISTASARSDVVNTASVEGIENDNKMQFAERYFSDLRKQTGTSDDFLRPATTWRLKSTTIGTYADEADLTYTEAVKIGDIYSDLGLDNAIPAKDTAVYEDGQASQSTTNSVKWDNYDIARGQKAKIGGNGALTEVFYDADDDSVVITVVNTYVGKVDRVMSASSTRDPYVVISDPGSVATAPAANLTFETEAFDEDDVVLYTYSYDTKEVESLDAAEMVTGTVTEAQNKQTDSVDSQNVTLDGAKYSAAASLAATRSATLQLTTNTTCIWTTTAT